ncbi:MAG TPA: Fe-S cluster assembly protein SufD [Blastocatellia bacterium]|jgi:Fe-S cluster assembly protein SufD
MTGARKTPDVYLSNFAQLEKRRGRNGDSWLNSLRNNAIARFTELGFPTTKLEDWKFTNVAPITKIPFQIAEPGPGGLTADRLAHMPFADTAFCEQGSRIVFVDGHYSRELSSPDAPRGITVTSLAEAIKNEAPGLKAHLARHASFDRQAFVALNTAFLEDGAFVEIAQDVPLERPIYLLFVSTARERIASHPRSLVIVGEASQAAIIEDYVGLEDGVYFTNAVTEIVAGENSVVEHYKLQDESAAAYHVATLQAYQARSSSFTSHSTSFGGALVRNDVNVVLDGEGAQCTLNGLYVTADNQHVDNHTVIDHVKPHGASRELYKGILSDRSSAVFNGSIVVRKDAQKTDARQSNKNLLLSEEATINSKPQLEINADDVKCTHGTSIGHPDDDAIYYLRSRGIGEDEAQAVLTYGFADDVLNKMKIAGLRVRLECALLSRLSSRRTHTEA